MKTLDGMPIDENTSKEKIEEQIDKIKGFMNKGWMKEKEGKHLINLLNQHPAMQKEQA